MAEESFNIREKLFALNRVISEELTNFLKKQSLAGYGVKANEFDVFCAFWVTTCSVRTGRAPLEKEIEDFNRSVIVAIIDRIVAGQSEDLDDEYMNTLASTITEVFVERFSWYRECFRTDTAQDDKGEHDSLLSFPCLGEGVLTNILDRPLPELSPVRRLFDELLADLFKKSLRYLAG